jgi:hypothetical protein
MFMIRIPAVLLGGILPDISPAHEISRSERPIWFKLPGSI